MVTVPRIALDHPVGHDRAHHRNRRQAGEGLGRDQLHLVTLTDKFATDKFATHDVADLGVDVGEIGGKELGLSPRRSRNQRPGWQGSCH
jgi:hypothetical protein